MKIHKKSKLNSGYRIEVFVDVSNITIIYYVFKKKIIWRIIVHWDARFNIEKMKKY